MQAPQIPPYSPTIAQGRDNIISQFNHVTQFAWDDANQTHKYKHQHHFHFNGAQCQAKVISLKNPLKGKKKKKEKATIIFPHSENNPSGLVNYLKSCHPITF